MNAAWIASHSVQASALTASLQIQLEAFEAATATADAVAYLLGANPVSRRGSNGSNDTLSIDLII